MKIVHTADWHIGKLLCDYSLLEDQRYWFDRFLHRLEELRPDALIVAGDLYDRSVPSAEAIALLDDILSRIVLELKIPTFLIAGNHDSRERLSFASGLLERSGLYIAGNVEREIRRVVLRDPADERDVCFYLLPYVEPHNVKMLYPEAAVKTTGDALRILCGDMVDRLDPAAVNILVGHGLFSYRESREALEAGNDGDISVGGSDLADISLFEEFDYCAFGHLHSMRTAGCERMRYSGSPLKYSIDEAAQNKSFTIAEVGKGTLSLTFETIPPLRDVRIIEGEFAALLENAPPSGREDYLFVHLTDREIVLNAMSRLKAVYPYIIGLRYVNLNAVSMDRLAQQKNVIERLSEPELFAGFYESVTEEPLTAGQKEYVSQTFRQLTGEATV